MNTYEVNIGVDVSKQTLAAAFPDGRVTDFTNDTRGLASLVAKAKARGPSALVCCEATGGYEQGLVDACHQAGVAVAVANAKRVRDFAKGKGQLAKTDAIDARIIARFAAENRPRPTEPQPQWQRRLRALCDRRAALAEDIAREKNRLEIGRDRWVTADTRSHIRQLQAHMEKLEREVAALRAATPEFERQASRLESVKGIGPVSAYAFMAYLPELGSVSGNEASALAGVAPYNDDSGRHRGQRRIRGGRARLRCALWMAAMAAARFNPILKAFYEGLRRREKPHKVAIVAVIRKLVCLANKIITDPNFVPA
jgi:transposase